MAANGEVMYAAEGPYTIDVRHVEKMVGTTREAADGDRVRQGLDGDETGGPRDETGDKTAATAGDERDDYITTMYFVLCIVCCIVYCLLCITVLCCANNQMQIFSKKKIIFS